MKTNTLLIERKREGYGGFGSSISVRGFKFLFDVFEPFPFSSVYDFFGFDCPFSDFQF